MTKCSFLMVLVWRTSIFTQCRIVAKGFEREQHYGNKCDLQKPPVAIIFDFGKSRRINDPNIYCSVKCNPEPRRRWIATKIFYGTGHQTVQSDIFLWGNWQDLQQRQDQLIIWNQLLTNVPMSALITNEIWVLSKNFWKKACICDPVKL